MATTLRSSLAYEPQVLKFGTSGRRGEVVHLTQLEIYINALAELEYLQSLPPADGGIGRGDEFYYASDLRPSSFAYVPEQGGRGEIAQAIEQAIRDAGMIPVNLGLIPTPALTCYAIERGKGSIMITGSHIPFDRNGYKTNTAHGELLKKDEAPINARVEQVRQRIYEQPFAESIFDERGLFKSGHRDLLRASDAAREAYIARYTRFFAGQSLKGLRLLAYQHSAVGRDLLVDLLRRLGAEVIPAGRSETFVPIDTEAIDAEQLANMQQLAIAAWQEHGLIDAVISTDGDSDRPLILGVDPTPSPGTLGEARGEGPPCRVRFFGGDLVGMIVAEYLHADAVVVPISCNDALDRGVLKEIVEPKTRIGSPFVIAGMQKAREKGRRAVCGWEANGGFLTGCDIVRGGKTLTALPTRDAMLPILGVLFAAREKGLSLSALFDRLPARYSKAALLRKFPRPTSLKIVDRFSPTDPAIADVIFDNERVTLLDAVGHELKAELQVQALRNISKLLAEFFTAELGFGTIIRLNYTDGVRIYFSTSDVAHIRPSGNADELRIYAVADTQARADAITAMGVAEPNGILRRLERAAEGGPTTSPKGLSARRADLDARRAEAEAKFREFSESRLTSLGKSGGFGFESKACFLFDYERLRRLSEADLEQRRLRLEDARQHGQHVLEHYLLEAATECAREFLKNPRLLRLNGATQHYDWGGFEFIPSLLGIPHLERKSFAELWVGAHPSAPATVDVDGFPLVPLTMLTELANAHILGEKTAKQFGSKLPYLFKVLDARKMLSIQAHPTLEQAKEGFARENAAGIPLDAPHRNYKDDNHKPEVHVALTEFWMLHGFRPLEEIADVLATVRELTPVMPDFAARLARTPGFIDRQHLLRELYQTIMTMPQEHVDAILRPLIERLRKNPTTDKDTPDFWALRAADDFPLAGGHIDRGIFSIYLLNLVHLKPGEGTYQPAGTLHAYLEGVNVELMANSDNVLRGGLTSKHMDVPELMRILSFTDGKPEILRDDPSEPVVVYSTPAAEFELSRRVRVTPQQAYISPSEHSADILLVMEGKATFHCGRQAMDLERGGIILAPSCVRYSAEGDAVIFRASVPQ